MVARKIDRAEARQLRSEGWKLKDLAARYGVTVASVSYTCGGITPAINHRGTSGENFAAYRARRTAAMLDKQGETIRLRRCGHSLAVIADRLGISITTAHRLSKGVRKSSAQAEPLMKDAVTIPPWLPEYLHGIYLDVGMKRGEHAAASVCRRLKQEAAASCR